jgi:hypothetical protein
MIAMTKRDAVMRTPDRSYDLQLSLAVSSISSALSFRHARVANVRFGSILLKNSEFSRQENFGRSALQQRHQAGTPLGAVQRLQVELHFVGAGPPASRRHRRLKRLRFFAVGGTESFSTQ